MNITLMKSKSVINRLKRKPKPVLTLAKRLRSSNIDEKTNNNDSAFDKTSLERDNDSKLDCSLLPSVQAKAVLSESALSSKQSTLHDVMISSVTNNSCVSGSVPENTIITPSNPNSATISSNSISANHSDSATASTSSSTELTSLINTISSTSYIIKIPFNKNNNSFSSSVECYNIANVSDNEVTSSDDETDKSELNNQPLLSRKKLALRKVSCSERNVISLSEVKSNGSYLSINKLGETTNLGRVSCTALDKTDAESAIPPSLICGKSVNILDDFDTTKVKNSIRKKFSMVSNVSRVPKSYIGKKIPNLIELRSKAYDEDGKLNKNNLTLRDFIYFNPPHNPMKSSYNQAVQERCDIINSNESSDCESTETETNTETPRVKVSEDGKIIVDPESITRPCKVDKMLKKIKKSKIIEEDEYSTRLKIMNHLRNKKNESVALLFCSEGPQTHYSKYWTLEETLKFYKVLNEFGSDFSVMCEAFPYRTRKQLKRKFLTEEKVRINYIDLAMKERDTIDFDALEKELKSKFVEREAKRKEKLERIEKEKEFKKFVQQGQKIKFNSDVLYENCRLEKVYNEKEKNLRICIKKLKEKYLKEKGEKKKNCKTEVVRCQKRKRLRSCRKRNLKKFNDEGKSSDIDSGDNESSQFDIMNPLLKIKLYQEQKEILQAVEKSYVENINDEDDVDLFFELISKMYPAFGKDWKDWVKNEIINLLLRKEDCGAKRAAIKIKTEQERKINIEKLENSFQLFGDPYDFTDPFVNNGNDL